MTVACFHEKAWLVRDKSRHFITRLFAFFLFLTNCIGPCMLTFLFPATLLAGYLTEFIHPCFLKRNS
jgi:hypothetical protein